MKYDVIVCGGGPAGGSCVRELSKKGYKVLLLDRSLEIGEPNFSTAGTPLETIKDFNLPKDIIFTYWNSFSINGPNESVEFIYDKDIGCTMKFRELKQFLVKDAINHGCETKVNASVTKPIIKNNIVSGVEFIDENEKETAYADIVVDATGSNGVLASQLVLRKTVMDQFAPCVEYLMENLNLARNSKMAEIFIGNKYRAGYAWIFPTGKNEAKVGLGWVKDEDNKDKDLLQNLKEFVLSNNQLKNGEVLELHSHSLFINGGIKKHSLNGFLAIGDAAAQINLLFAEGIRHCLWSGRIAASVIDRTLNKKGKLSNYDNEWIKYTKNKWGLCAKLFQYGFNLDDKSINTAIDILKKFDKEDIFDIAFHYKFSLFLKYIKYAPRILSKDKIKKAIRLFRS